MKIEMGKQYRTKHGKKVRRVLCVDRADTIFPVLVEYEDGAIGCYTIEGRFTTNVRESAFDLVEVSPWDDFKDGDPVMVREYKDSLWERRYFARTEGTYALCYLNGKTKWSSDGQTTEWNYCRRPTEEEELK